MRPVGLYELIDRAYTPRLRGANNQQNNTSLIYQLPTVRTTTTFGAREGALTGSPGGGIGETAFSGIGLGGFSLHNRSGTTGISVGIGVRIPNRFWAAGQWVNAAATPFTDDTADAQDVDTADDVALETTTNSDGFVVHSRVLFNAISIDVDTADTGGAPVRAVRYSNAAGNGWTDFANLFLQDGAATAYITGEQLVIFSPPSDWGLTQAAGLNGIPGGRYAINVRANTAPATTGATAASLSLYRLYYLTEGIADNGTMEPVAMQGEMVMMPGDALVAFFSVANNQNRVTALVRPRE